MDVQAIANSSPMAAIPRIVDDFPFECYDVSPEHEEDELFCVSLYCVWFRRVYDAQDRFCVVEMMRCEGDLARHDTTIRLGRMYLDARCETKETVLLSRAGFAAWFAREHLDRPPASEPGTVPSDPTLDPETEPLRGPPLGHAALGGPIQCLC